MWGFSCTLRIFSGSATHWRHEIPSTEDRQYWSSYFSDIPASIMKATHEQYDFKLVHVGIWVDEKLTSFFDMLRSRPLFHTWIDIIFLSSNQIYLEVEKNKTARKKRSDSHMSFCHSIIEFPLSSVTNVLHKKFWVHTVYFTLEYEANHMSRDMTKPTKWLCAQRRLRSAWTSAQSDQSLRCPHEESLGS